MKTVQVSRRSASYRRRLFAAGVLSAVVALSYVGSAFAVTCLPDSIDLFDSDGDGNEGTAVLYDNCYCEKGYKTTGGMGCDPCANGGTATLVSYSIGDIYTAACGGIAPGYFGTAKADDTADADAPSACTDVYTSATLDHVTSTTPAASGTTTKLDCKTKPGYYLATVYDGSNDASTVTAKVTANSYGAGGVALSATTDNSVNACPQNSNSVAGSAEIGDCKCGAGYKATAANTCETCPQGTVWVTAPSVGTSATFCEAIKADYYGTLGSGADASPTACPSGGWTSAGITSGGPTTIADCFQDASGITPDKTMYGKSGDSDNIYHCPTGTVSTAVAAVGTESYCSSIAQGYYGTQGTAGAGGAHASSTIQCPINSDSAESAVTTTRADCFQDASGITPDKTMYGKSSDSTNVYHCPTGTVSTAVAAVGTESYCSSIAQGYYGTQGTAGTGGAHASTIECPIYSDSAESAVTTTITACKCGAGYKATAANTCETCPPGTDWTTAPSVGTSATFCEEILAGYYGVYGNGADASPTACPENSDSAAGSTELADCECAANFYPSNNACVACATGTTREGTVSVTGTATCSTADSAGATAPIAVALAAAAAVPLLL